MLEREIREYRDMRQERGRGLQLEARNLAHDCCLGIGGRERWAELRVAHALRAASGGGQHRSDQGAGCGLAIGAGNGDDGRRGDAPAELELVEDLHALLGRRPQQRDVYVDARALHDGGRWASSRKRIRAVAAERDLQASRAPPCCLDPDLAVRRGIPGRHRASAD
jgi:hypothetical protein